MFLKEVSYVHQGCIYLIKNTQLCCEILLRFKRTVFIWLYFTMLFIPVMVKLNFQHLQNHLIFHKSF